MQGFIHRQNLKNYRELLAEATDAEMRGRLSQLIEDEEKVASERTRDEEGRKARLT